MSRKVTAPAIEGLPAGMVPWNGGDAAPADWDGGPVLFRHGDMSVKPPVPAMMYWQRGSGEHPFDIIGYTPRTTPPEPSSEVVEACNRIDLWMDDQHTNLAPGQVGVELAYDDVTTVVRAARLASRQPTPAPADDARVRDGLDHRAWIAAVSATRRYVRHDDDCHVMHEGETADCSCGARVALLCFDDAITASPKGPSVAIGADGCSCQRYPTHQANDCPLHGLEAPFDGRPLEEHQCWSKGLGRLSHRHWFQGNGLMPTCERCGTPIDREHKEIGPVSWIAPERQPNASVAIGAGEVREGCIGTMTPERAIYFLERFKREEKWLGPHEQWALDYTIAALAPASASEAAAYRSDGLWWLEIAEGKGYDSITAALEAAPASASIPADVERHLAGGDDPSPYDPDGLDMARGITAAHRILGRPVVARTTVADHGTGQQAIEWILHHSGDGLMEADAFLRSWEQGDLGEWPEFYAWLAARPSTGEKA